MSLKPIFNFKNIHNHFTFATGYKGIQQLFTKYANLMFYRLNTVQRLTCVFVLCVCLDCYRKRLSKTNYFFSVILFQYEI